jgi:hypothetical protein
MSCILKSEGVYHVQLMHYIIFHIQLLPFQKACTKNGENRKGNFGRNYDLKAETNGAWMLQLCCCELERN